ncbi:hypothetical protein ThidrDRAFT_4386 [Thiorhodococcus drewsii AZ1]|uniref:Uncharacterized protein n=1 Tax=Thiorhodococcus drewsii AZ1 TaxID=765913 RepID=G2E7X2_9GAMM|nr:HPr-rel-A system PqqD family peptide chaperone [Thiorhodococcus drewsii]EGV27812.1 hypothetical protein ThidrDRAFT_4386 [Thiorhodococcus drewsii AZ1]
MLLYRKASTGNVLALEWDGEQLLYQLASGETHYLNGLGAIVFACLGENPLGLSEVRRRVLAEAGMDEGDAAGQGPGDAELKGVLDRFVELGLADSESGSEPL